MPSTICPGSSVAATTSEYATAVLPERWWELFTERFYGEKDLTLDLLRFWGAFLSAVFLYQEHLQPEALRMGRLMGQSKKTGSHFSFGVFRLFLLTGHCSPMSHPLATLLLFSALVTPNLATALGWKEERPEALLKRFSSMLYGGSFKLAVTLVYLSSRDRVVDRLWNMMIA